MFHFMIHGQSYTLSASHKDEDCTKGYVSLEVKGLQPADNMSIAWSSGQTGVYSIGDVGEGAYTVSVTITRQQDTSVVTRLDTVINIQVEKKLCEVLLSNHFTPNGDDYNDTWSISNWQYYPEFELYVFNKWGQRVHRQKGTYTPWDGKWNGVNVPDGTYYYVFYPEGEGKNVIKGDVTILR